MTPTDLVAWRERHGLSRRKAADILGCHRNSMNAWERGDSTIPRYIAMACAAYSHGVPPMGD